MPSLRRLIREIGVAERIPPRLFYVPLVLKWLWLSLRYGSLSLPTLANPLVDVGGPWGESKKAYLDMVSGEARRWLARCAALARAGRSGSGRGTRDAPFSLCGHKASGFRSWRSRISAGKGMGACRPSALTGFPKLESSYGCPSSDPSASAVYIVTRMSTSRRS
jgi:hypothetical protein